MTFDGTSWVVVSAAGFSPGAVLGTSLALDDVGTPYVSFADGASAGKATVMAYGG